MDSIFRRPPVLNRLQFGDPTFANKGRSNYQRTLSKVQESQQQRMFGRRLKEFQDQQKKDEERFQAHLKELSKNIISPPPPTGLLPPPQAPATR